MKFHLCHLLSGAWLALLLVACAEPPPAVEEPPPEAVQRGAPCAPENPCEVWLHCVDGTCREVPWPGEPAPEEPTVVPRPDVPPPPEVEGPQEDAWVDADDVGPEDGFLPSDAKPPLPPKDVKEPPADTSSQPDLPVPPEITEDVAQDVPDETEEDTSADVPAPTEDVVEEDTGPAPPVVILYVSDDQAATSPGTQFLSLVPGQGWVTDLVLPKTGKVIAMEALVDNVYNDASCGLFRPAVWVQNDDGDWPHEPSWHGASLQALQGSQVPQTFLVSDPPELPEGVIRAGLIFEEPCDGDPPIPWLFTDDSGDLEGTWLWSGQAQVSPWVPGSFLGVEGRWALRILLEVTIPAGG